MVFFGSGWWLCEAATIRLDGVDAPQIVIDEILAFPFAVLGLQFARRASVMALAFALYRLFDILKPWPIRTIESIPGGLGIMLDDVAAASWVWLIRVFGRVVTGKDRHA